MSRARRAARLRSTERSGFTLIELLVVVAIISMLLAILLPSLRKARSAARCTACQANLKSLTHAWHMYLDDHGGRFLQQGVNTDINYGGRQGEGSRDYGADSGQPVTKPLNRFLNLPVVARTGAEVFHCPADNGDEVTRPSHFVYYGTSYRTNPLVVGHYVISVRPDDPCKDIMGQAAQRLKGLSWSKIANEPKLLLMGDFGWYNAWYFAYPVRWHFDWHGRKNHHNMAFVDGHVSLLRFRKGLNTTAEYTVIPFGDLQEAAVPVQVEVPTE